MRADTLPASPAPKSPIINIVRRSLGYIDRRLMEHGERVAYIAEMIAAMDDTLPIDRDQLLILCLLHDIGAYKTEEIDNMLQFETGNVENHSMYGYIFLKNATFLGDLAEAVLHHHTRYDQLSQLNAPYETYAALIFLADRTDILLMGSGPAGLDSLRALSGSLFSPRLVQLLFAAENERHISAHILDGSYVSTVTDWIDSVPLSVEQKMQFLSMLVYSIDFRSPFTVTHTANTAGISRKLAELFGFGGDELQAIRFGAFLHDIGKIAIPYSILESPEKLSPEQMEIMKTHVAYSDEILTGVVSEQVRQIAIRHHERPNGTGYHRGLSLDALTLPERIVAVSDVISALINRRSYKEPFPKEAVVSILRRMAEAGELCPTVVDMALAHFDDITGFIDPADNPVIELYESIQSQYAALTKRQAESAN